MAAIRFFTDEDVYGATAPALRNAGWDAVSTPEAGRLGQSDESQLQWAMDQGRVFVTLNVRHFAHLHSTWMNQDRDHAGIILSAQRPLGDLRRRLVHLASTLDGDAMRNRIECRDT